MTDDTASMSKNLQLALISSVLELDGVDAESVTAHCDARLMEIEDDPELADELWAQPVPELVEYILAQDLQAHFGEVTELYLDGGSEAYQLTSLFWDGEDDAYDVGSFEGIEACSSLSSLKVASMLPIDQPVSLAPLAKLPKLEKVWIGAGTITDVDSLLEAPAIESVELGRYVTVADADSDELAEKFRARGIAMNVK